MTHHILWEDDVGIQAGVQIIWGHDYETERYVAKARVPNPYARKRKNLNLSATGGTPSEAFRALCGLLTTDAEDIIQEAHRLSRSRED